MTRTTALRLVALFAIVGAALRAYTLNSGLWFDEIVTLIESVRPPMATVLTAFPGNNNHPFYSLLAHLSIAGFGDEPWALRLPALLFGVAGIPLLYWVGTLVTTRSEALWSALLLSVSYHAVWFAQNARGYTMLLAFTLLATALMIQLLERPSPRRAVWYGLAAGLGVYTHLTMVFVVAAHALVWAWDVWRAGFVRARVHAAIISLVGAAVISLALYLPMLGAVYAFFTGPPQGTAAVATSSWAALEMLKGLQIGYGGLGVLAALALMAIGGLSYVRRTPVVAALFVLPGALTGGAMVVLHAPIRPRFFFLMAGFALLMLVRGAVLAGAWLEARFALRAHGIVSRIALGLMVAASLWSLRFNYQYPKQDFAQALNFVEQERGAGDAVGTAGLVSYPFEAYYGRDWTSLESAPQFEALVESAAHSWIVYSFPEYMDAGLVLRIRAQCPTRRTFPGTLGGGDVVVCSAARPRP